MEAKQETQAVATSVLVDRHRVQLIALAVGAVDADAVLTRRGAVVEVLLGVHSHVSPGLRACVSKRAPLALAAALCLWTGTPVPSRQEPHTSQLGEPYTQRIAQFF